MSTLHLNTNESLPRLGTCWIVGRDFRTYAQAAEVSSPIYIVKVCRHMNAFKVKNKVIGVQGSARATT